MPTYLVTWEIEVDADNPLEAALKAEDYQYNQVNKIDTLGGVFTVNSLTSKEVIDLEEYYAEKDDS